MYYENHFKCYFPTGPNTIRDSAQESSVLEPESSQTNREDSNDSSQPSESSKPASFGFESHKAASHADSSAGQKAPGKSKSEENDKQSESDSESESTIVIEIENDQSKKEEPVNTAAGVILIPDYYKDLSSYGMSQKNVKWQDGKWYYQIQKTDTIWNILNAFDISLDELIELNGWKQDTSLPAGTYIVIPNK